MRESLGIAFSGAKRIDHNTKVEIMANDKMTAQMASKDGFIAALDQSGGSTPGRAAPLRHSGQRLQRRGARCSSSCTRCGCAS